MRQPSALGVLVRHPLAIRVDVQAGRVMLSGPVLSDEVEQLVRNVRAIRGVQEV
jgi:osmotically-inducible protein OsmY